MLDIFMLGGAGTLERKEACTLTRVLGNSVKRDTSCRHWTLSPNAHLRRCPCFQGFRFSVSDRLKQEARRFVFLLGLRLLGCRSVEVFGVSEATASYLQKFTGPQHYIRNLQTSTFEAQEQAG